MKQVFGVLVLFVCMPLMGFAEGAAESQQLEGQSLREIVTLNDVPVKVKTLLGVGSAGLHGVADRGEAFNASDLVDSRLPMRRFAVGGVGNNITLIALEHGGFVYYVEVFLFSDINGTPKIEKKWKLPSAVQHKRIVPYLPTTLKEVIERIPTAPRENDQPS